MNPERVGTWRAFAFALACVYGPHLLPLATTPLQECDHCVHAWTVRLPLLPGMLASTLLHCAGLVSDDLRERLVPSLATAAILVIATVLVRVTGRHSAFVIVLIAGLATAHAFALANLFRM